MIFYRFWKGFCNIDRYFDSDLVSCLLLNTDFMFSSFSKSGFKLSSFSEFCAWYLGSMKFTLDTFLMHLTLSWKVLLNVLICDTSEKSDSLLWFVTYLVIFSKNLQSLYLVCLWQEHQISEVFWGNKKCYQRTPSGSQIWANSYCISSRRCCCEGSNYIFFRCCSRY